MKTPFSIIILILFLTCTLRAQQTDSTDGNSWKFSAEAFNYLIPDNYIFLPILKADRRHLHLEARYNYEDLNTASTWLGYNFNGGNRLAYSITPMIGAAFGNSNGLAPGLEFDLTYNQFELSSESEYLMDLQDISNSFFYMWTDLTYSPAEWLWFGISTQRTRLYKTDLDLQRGLLLGGGWKNWEFTGYVYNLGFRQPIVLLSLVFNFPD
ncbi:MAG TPA: hypothetical protein PLQ93_11435 [Bacteroidia bacterium]|nr:hypothetical protein [Bacteroidia bacterium]